MNATRRTAFFAWLFRAALFAAAASLAVYIPYKYATQLHAVSGFYAALFPLSALLAAAGMIVAVKPAKACDCGVPVRSSIVALSVLWLATGVMCVGTLSAAILEHPLHGSIATFHMLAQHVFLSLALIAFALTPQRVARGLGVEVPPARTTLSSSAPA